MRWVGISVVVFLVVNALTFWPDVTETDDMILGRLQARASLIKPSYLEGAADRPLELCKECRVDDPFAAMTGSGCRWSEALPYYSCRIGGLPVTIWHSSRLGGAQEAFLTLLSRAMGPLRATRVLKTSCKIAILLLLFWAIRIFALPEAMLPFLAMSLVFHELGQISWMEIFGAAICWLCLCLSFTRGRKAFVGACLCSGVLTYLYIGAAFTLIPVVIVLAARKEYRRAALLSLASCGFFAARVLVNVAHPILNAEFSGAMLGERIWAKPLSDYWTYLRDVWSVFSMTDALSLKSIPFSSLGAGAVLILFLSAFVRGATAKRGLALAALFVVTSFPFFLFAHAGEPTYIWRMHHIAPIALMALYLGAEACRDRLARSGRTKLSLLPMAWLWIAGIASCGLWIHDFRESGPLMTMNADYFARLSQHLAQSGVHTPIVLHETNAVGMIDVYSSETVRPLYLSDASFDPVEPGDGFVASILASWVRLGQGTLLQRNTFPELGGASLAREQIEKFAAEHMIRITGLELFPYREDQGYWIIHFVNRRFERYFGQPYGKDRNAT